MRTLLVEYLKVARVVIVTQTAHCHIYHSLYLTLSLDASTWVDEESATSCRPTATVNNMITSDDDKVACLRCRGKVYEAEKVIAAHGLFHRRYSSDVFSPHISGDCLLVMCKV